MVPARGLAVLLLPALALALPGAVPQGASVLFADDFESLRPWASMEEVAGACYGLGLGRAGWHPSAARTGSWGYRVYANEAESLLSNHVFGAMRVAHASHVAPLRYEVWATRDPVTNDTTQNGPEFGVQVTHFYEGLGFRTTTFGFQYVGGPFSPPFWQLWVPNATAPSVAEWRPYFNRTLEAGVWHRFVLEADLTIPAYTSLVVEAPTWRQEVDVRGVPVARELKWHEPATWVSVDAGSLWAKCGASWPPLARYQARVWYDDVRLERLDGP